jgi:hypothetical protein
MHMGVDELISLHTKAYKANMLPIYVITSNPSDYPGKFVVRVQYPSKVDPIPGPIVAVAETLDDAREALVALPLVRMDRHPDDDAVIVETWL